MKKLFVFCFLLSIVFGATAQKMYLFKDATKAYMGFKDGNGNIIIEANKYKCSTRYSDYSEGFITCSKEGYWGFLDERGKEMSAFKYDTPSQFSEGLAFVSYHNRFGYIDKTGNFIIENRYQNAQSFSEGCAAVKYNGKWGFIDAKGNTTINFLFDDAMSFRDGVAALKFNGNWGLFNKSAEIIVSPAYEFIYPFKNGFAMYKLYGSYGFFDKKGKKINQKTYFDCHDFKDGYAIVSISSEKDKGLGVIDTTGKEIIEPKLENEKITFKNDIFYVKRKDTKEEKTFNKKGEAILILGTQIMTETELFNSIMSNSAVSAKEPTLQEIRDKIFEDLRDNSVKGTSTGSDIGDLSEFTTPPPNYQANVPTKAKEYDKVSSAESSANNDDFCKELNFILTAIEKEELGDIVDYKKPLGITQSWFSSKVKLSGFENLQGQSLFSNLSFVGYLTNSNTSDNDKLYKKLVADIDSCLSGYNKEKNEYNKGITFINKNNKNLKLKIDFYGFGKSIEISFRN